MASSLRVSKLATDALFLTIGFAGCYAFGFARPLAARLGWHEPDQALNLGLAALTIGAGAFAMEAVRLMLHVRLRAAAVWKGRHQESGSIIVEFAVALPLLLWLLSMVFQMALFANASCVVKYAAFAAARSAAVGTERRFLALSENLSGRGEDDAKIAAHLVLAAISPRNSAPDSAGAGLAMYQTVGRQGAAYVSRVFPNRVDYAQRNSTIQFELVNPPLNPLASRLASTFMPAEFTDRMVNPIGNSEVKVTISYNLYLVIPGIDYLPGMPIVPVTVHGRRVRAMVVTAAHQIPTTGPREAHPIQSAAWAIWFGTALSPSDPD